MARPVQALVVEIRDSSGALAPQGTVVRFAGVSTAPFAPEMWVQSLTSNFFVAFATGETDAAGRTAVLIQFGTKAGDARIAISVPTLGVEDTARYTVLPGAPDRIQLEPRDTVIYAGASFTVRGGVADRFGNTRSDPVAFSASTGATVTSTGVAGAAAIGRYTLTATVASFSGTSNFSVVPSGSLAAVRFGTNGWRIISVGLDGSGLRDLAGVNDGGIGPRPRWIPGTSSIVYSHYDGTNQGLRTVNQDGLVATLVSSPPATMTHQAEPSPAANAPVLYFSAHDSRCSTEFYCLHRSGMDGSAPELLGTSIATGEVTWRPAASPDGSKVAFVTTGTIIRVFDYATRTASAWSVSGQHPSWSPDGTMIAYVPQFGGTLRLVNANGTNPRTIANNRTYSETPITWMSDSQWLLARNAQSAMWELVEIATGNAVPLGYSANFASASLK